MLRAPVARPGKVIGIGINYHSHVEETRDFLAAQGIEPPAVPVFFLAPGSAVIGPEEAIVLPAVAPEQVDYEIELSNVQSMTKPVVATGLVVPGLTATGFTFSSGTSF